jgi:hypothetical protein
MNLTELNQERIAKYGKLFCDISGILFKHDPMGINFEDNMDEYDPEARTIIARLNSAKSGDDVEKIIVEEFDNWFKVDELTPQPVSREGYKKIADEVWEACSESRKTSNNFDSYIAHRT